MCVVAEFSPVVRGGCRRGAKLVGRRAEGIEQGLQGLRRVVLDDARLIEHNTTEARNVKLVQPVVIRDGDARSNVCAFAGVRHGNADAFSFLDRLLGDGERRKDQHIAASLTVHGVGPGQLHAAFAKAGISEYRRPPAPQRPCRKVALVRKHAVVEHWRGDAFCARRAEFRAYKFVIFQRRLQESMPANNAVNGTGENPPARYLGR